MFHGKSVLPVGKESGVATRVFLAALLSFIVLTRWPLAPRFLYYFDSANFALSLEHFDPSLHQPQPPGYPLFVLFIRLIHFWVRPSEQVLVIAGLIAAGAATLLAWLFARDLFGNRAGLLAAALLASDPAFWFAGITNQVRLFLAVGALSVSFFGWRALESPRDRRWFYAALGTLGIVAGFRPALAVLLVPLLAHVWWHTGHAFGRLAVGIALAAATAAPSVAAVLIAVGGLAKTIEICWNYSTVQFGGTSALFGASSDPAWLMIRQAVTWNFLGALVWIWAVPFLPWRSWTPRHTRKLLFLLAGFVPIFLFSALVHIGDPDQALASVALLSVAGGAVLAQFLERAGSRRVFAAGTAVIALHALLFFVPPTRLAKASSYKAVAAVDRMNAAAIDGIAAVHPEGPLTIVHFGSPVASRHLEYYFPEAYVLVLPGTPGHPEAADVPQVFYRHQSRPALGPGLAPVIPSSHRIVGVFPPGYQPAGWRKSGSVYYIDRNSHESIEIGPFKIEETPR